MIVTKISLDKASKMKTIFQALPLKRDYFKKQKNIVVAILGLIFLGQLILLAYLSDLKQSCLLQYDQHQAQSSKIRHSAEIFQKGTDPFLSTYKKKQMARVVKDQDGFKIIERIRRQLHLGAFKIHWGADHVLQPHDHVYEKSFEMIVTSHLDDKVYQLIDRLHHQLPGVFYVDELSLKEKKIDLFESKIKCRWIRRKAE